MRFFSTIKEIKRLSTASNDTEFSIRLITNENLGELMSIEATDLVEVEINICQN